MSQARVKSSELRDGEERSVSQPLLSQFPCVLARVPGASGRSSLGSSSHRFSHNVLSTRASFEIYHANILLSQDLYKNGGLISVTSRILVVDMLQSDLPTELVTGLLILHAEK